MSAQKRQLAQTHSYQKSKKLKLSGSKVTGGKKEDAKSVQHTSTTVQEEVDFPRGGGTSFTPLEVKAIRTEAVEEADQEMFRDAQTKAGKAKKRKRHTEASQVSGAPDSRTNVIRVEHLNYKRLNVGMKIFGQIISVQPLALVVSLPNQLLGHVPITQISNQYTKLLEAMENGEQAAVDDYSDTTPRVPDLSDIFVVGQYVRAVVTGVHESGSTDMSGIGRTRDEVARASRRVELSLVPEEVNATVQKSDLQAGFTLTAAVKSVEDHGYILELGIPDVSAFISFEEMKIGQFGNSTRLQLGQLVDVVVSNLSGNRRICKVTVNPELFASSMISEVTNIASILPGMLVRSLVTAASHVGLHLQVMGFFEGTVDQFHMLPGSPEKHYRIGRKLKARILYCIPSDPPRLVLSTAPHVVRLAPRTVEGAEAKILMQDVYPIGTVLHAVKVVRTEPERGLVVEVKPGLEGYIHISHISSEHTPSLSFSVGPGKIGATHKARVTGYHAFDGLLQLSMRPSILNQKFLQVTDLQVGVLVRGVIKKVGESGLVITIAGDLTGVVWPEHYADIRLKHPSKRFKVGAKLRCKVLALDPERKHIALTAKKSLLESDLPIISAFEDAVVGLVTHGVVSKVSEKHLIIDFYNKIKALIVAKEASEAESLQDAFYVGKVVKVRITSVDPESQRIQASIRQASSNVSLPFGAITDIEVGQEVGGVVAEIHKDNAVLALNGTNARALISLKNIAKYRGSSVSQLRDTLKPGDKLEGLLVVTRNLDKGFVIVANKPQTKSAIAGKHSLSIDTLTVGQIVIGRVIRHTRRGAFVKLSSHLSATLHATDVSDDYEIGVPFPSVDSVIKAIVIDIDKNKKSVVLSTRRSRLNPVQDGPIPDREINSVEDLKTGDTIRGFIKSVAEHGLFVSLGRDIDARVQIKELFDEYVKDWKSRFSTDRLVKGRIIAVDTEKKQVEMSFRSGNHRRNTKSSSLADFQEGQIVNAHIKKIEDYGLFVLIEGSKVSGLCHKSELSDNLNADVTTALHGFREGDKVTVKILSIDTAKHRISFGLKPSYFLGTITSEAESSDSDDEGRFEQLGTVEDREAEPENERSSQESESDEDIENNGSPTRTFPPTSPDPVSNESTLALKIPGGFRWTGTAELSENMHSESSSAEGDNAGQSIRKKKRRKEIEYDMTADMHSKPPESTADFERLLLGSPDSSYLWVQYMSFQLQLSEVDKAREIGRRALETINLREEQEKLNVWIALLNLENVYGTGESLEATFKDAARRNDSKTVHLRLANIFDQAGKREKAEEQYNRTCKKFSQSSKVWTLFAEYLFRQGESENARKLLPRGLQSLAKRKHLKTISKFAQLEYKLGDSERGKTIFEGIVDSHPKRWDIWSIYMDMEAAKSDIQSLRNLFDRVLSLKMTSYKAKSFFKKWLNLERKLGDEEGATVVKHKAVEWTQRAANSS